METNNIDSIIKKAIEASGNFYGVEANKSKDKIWKHVQRQKQSHPRLILLRFLTASCILLLISTSVITISLVKTKKSMKTLVEVNSILKKKATVNNQNTSAEKKPVTAANVNSPDTIYIEKIRTASKPVIKTIQVVDTVYVKQIVYVEKEQHPELLTTNENSMVMDSTYQKNTNNYETNILISNRESVKQEKRKRIQIKFGGNKVQTSEGRLAFTAKL